MTTNNPPYGEPEYPSYGEHDRPSPQPAQSPPAQSPPPAAPVGDYGTTPYGFPAYRENQQAGQYGAGQYGPGYYGQGQYGGNQYGYPGQQQPGQQYPGQWGYFGPAGYGTPAPAPKHSNRGKWLLATGAGLLAAVLVVGAVAFSTSNSGTDSVTGSGSALQFPQSRQGTGGSSTGGSTNGGSLPNGGSSQGSTSGGTTTATSTQQTGVVTIVSLLKYQSAKSAGTGTILSSNGEILTNNHVVNGATRITVTVETTGKSYRADVVGTAPTMDVAVLKLRNASGLQTAKYADTATDIKIGDSVTGVGNAGGTGDLTAAAGSVTALNKTITATNDSGQEAERLHNLIQVNAPIIAGDSGGPLYDSGGEVIGMDTAASSNRSGAASVAYAITIDSAMNVANQIESGVQTTTIHIGLPGFLGIAPEAGAGGVLIPANGVVAGSPAAKAGITPGSTITKINGASVTSPTALHNLLSQKDPGSKVSVSWTDVNGASHTATVTLATGPAD